MSPRKAPVRDVVGDPEAHRAWMRQIGEQLRDREVAEWAALGAELWNLDRDVFVALLAVAKSRRDTAASRSDFIAEARL